MSSYYRPSNSPDSLDYLNESIRRVFAKVKNHPSIIIGGDFNLGDIDWNATVPVPTNSNTATQHQKFLQITDDYSLSQHVKVPTRPVSGKVLDLLLTTYPNAVGDPSTITGLSDHLAVVFEVNLKPTRSVKPPHKVYLYNKANFPGLRTFMSDSSSTFFASKPEERSVEENWDMFKTSLTAGMSHKSHPGQNTNFLGLMSILKERCVKKTDCIKEPFAPKANSTGKLSNNNEIWFLS